jgi:hypothetical protein
MKTGEIDDILSVLLDVPTRLKAIRRKPSSKLMAFLISFEIVHPSYQVLEIKNIKLSTYYRLTAISNTLSRYELDASTSSFDVSRAVLDTTIKNTYAMASYVATAVLNENKPAPVDLIQAVADNFTNEELRLTIKEIYQRLDTVKISKIIGIPLRANDTKHPAYSKSPWGIIGSMMKYWRIPTINEALDQDYVNAMLLNACVPSYEDKDKGEGSSEPMSFFEFGKQLAGIK